MANFGSSNFLKQPDNVVQNFIYRSKYDESKPFISNKSGFKSCDFLKFGIHDHCVNGINKWINISELVINHYSIQSLELFKNRKLIIGDVNNYYDNTQMNMKYFTDRDSNEILDTRLKEQNLLIELQKK